MKNHALLFTIVMSTAALADGFALTSSTLTPNATMPDENVFNSFGCSGKNISPALKWEGAPTDTKSFAVTVYDPDAPTGSGWWHWVMFNIPAKTTELVAGAGNVKSNKAPKGAIQSSTDFGAPGYGGACPPEADKPHRYIFTVHALKVDKLPLKANATAAMVGYYLNQSSLAKATLTVEYGRQSGARN